MYAVGFRDYFGKDVITLGELNGLRVRIVDNPEEFDGFSIGETGTLYINAHEVHRKINIKEDCGDKYMGTINMYFDKESNMRGTWQKIIMENGSIIKIPYEHHSYVYLKEVGILPECKNKDTIFKKRGNRYEK